MRKCRNCGEQISQKDGDWFIKGELSGDVWSWCNHKPEPEVEIVKRILKNYTQERNPFISNPKPWKRR